MVYLPYRLGRLEEWKKGSYTRFTNVEDQSPSRSGAKERRPNKRLNEELLDFPIWRGAYTFLPHCPQNVRLTIETGL